MKCRHCSSVLSTNFVDLGSSPPSNAYLPKSHLSSPEKWFPLRVLVCEHCWLVQTEDFTAAHELFDSEYAYFSAFSTSWLAHSERYVDTMVNRFSLDSASHVVEVAANDGYLLQFVQKRGIPCTGIEPTASTAQAARGRGIRIVQEFFGENLANTLSAQGAQADLMVANNVLAHVPDINDFVSGFTRLLKPAGVVTFEFPHLLELIKHSQFDTIYHEHFSYLSLTAIQRIFGKAGLSIFDVERLSTHGGSLRVFAQRSDSGPQPESHSVKDVLHEEVSSGLLKTETYTNFQKQAQRVRNEFLGFLIQAQQDKKKVMGYGAAAKGNTLLNYAGVKADFVSAVVDKNPAKQNKYMPGSRIPIVDESVISKYQPDYIVIFPWNLKSEVMEQLSYIRDWGGKFVCAVPQLSVM